MVCVDKSTLMSMWWSQVADSVSYDYAGISCQVSIPYSSFLFVVSSHLSTAWLLQLCNLAKQTFQGFLFFFVSSLLGKVFLGFLC